MPVTINTLPSGDLVVNIIDANFNELRDYLRERIESGDHGAGKFSKFHIRRWSGGKLVNARTGTNELHGPESSAEEILQTCYHDTIRITDMVYTETSGSPTGATYDLESVTEDGADLPMEILGYPGPSFQFQYQEDGISPTHSSTAVIFNQQNKDIDKRFPDSHCYSYWLTVPHASTKVFVPEPCIAMVSGYMSVFQYHGNVCKMGNYFDPTQTIGGLTDRRMFAAQVGLVVDTNPIIHSDEFANTNPNIKDPATGSTAPRCSFKFIDKKTYQIFQRTVVKVRGVVALKGNRHYNFSMKYRDATTRGYKTAAAPNVLVQGRYEANNQSGGAYQGVDGARGGGAFTHRWEDLNAQAPPESLFESTSLNVEFFYGRDELTRNFANTEFIVAGAVPDAS